LIKRILQSDFREVKLYLESKLFERRRLDEKVGSFFYLGFVGTGIKFVNLLKA
jgi:hypothetical protein